MRIRGQENGCGKPFGNPRVDFSTPSAQMFVARSTHSCAHDQRMHDKLKQDDMQHDEVKDEPRA
jgi:hypothetical protein